MPPSKADYELLNLRDKLDDILTGVRVWKDSKENDWSDKDEMLSRWLERYDHEEV